MSMGGAEPVRKSLFWGFRGTPLMYLACLDFWEFYED